MPTRLITVNDHPVHVDQATLRNLCGRHGLDPVTVGIDVETDGPDVIVHVMQRDDDGRVIVDRERNAIVTAPRRLAGEAHVFPAQGTPEHPSSMDFLSPRAPAGTTPRAETSRDGHGPCADPVGNPVGNVDSALSHQVDSGPPPACTLAECSVPGAHHHPGNDRVVGDRWAGAAALDEHYRRRGWA